MRDWQKFLKNNRPGNDSSYIEVRLTIIMVKTGAPDKKRNSGIESLVQRGQTPMNFRNK